MKQSRLTFAIVVLSLWFGGIVVRLLDLQVRRHESFSQRAERQQQQAVKLDPPRGTIFDARGRELAVSLEVGSVAADPTAIDDPAATAAALAEILGLDVEGLTATLSADRAFVWVQRKIDPPQIERVRSLGLKGVFTLPESKRYYPMGSLAAQVLGYVGTDNTGLGGLEYLYQPVVASTPGRRIVMRDARYGTALHPALDVAETPKPGKDLHLALDAAIQHLAERELAAAIELRNARGGTVVVLDPTTGAVLAMASYPTFDPNHFGASPQSHWRNRAVMDAYEPGSTFKMVTLAAALEANVVDPLEKIDCQMGGITLRGRRIKDHHPFGELTTREIIARSSNVGAIKLGFAAGRQRLYDTIGKFGFGRPTGIDLPSESAGILRPLERWTELEPAYVSFGQSLSVTALQLTNAFAVIANGGYLLRPYLVNRLDDQGEPWRGRQVVATPIAPSSVTQVRSMLESVVLTGTGRAAAIDGYRVAGKTGTAQKAFRGRGYVDGKYVASFVGFAPLERPAVVCVVALDEPFPAYHGGAVAAPVWKAIVEQTLLYLGVPPDGDYDNPLPPTRLAAVDPAPGPEVM